MCIVSTKVGLCEMGREFDAEYGIFFIKLFLVYNCWEIGEIEQNIPKF